MGVGDEEGRKKKRMKGGRRTSLAPFFGGKEEKYEREKGWG
jgi:hypothetical protein